MQTFVTNESIKETKIIDDINKKRSQPSNLFGLGLVSLIAACGSSGDADNGADNKAYVKDSAAEGGVETTDTTETEASEAAGASEASDTTETEASEAAGASEASDTTEDSDTTDTTDTTEAADASEGTGLIFLGQSLEDLFGGDEAEVVEPYRALTLTSDLAREARAYSFSYDRDDRYIYWNETEVKTTFEPANEGDLHYFGSISYKIGGKDGHDMVIRSGTVAHDTKTNTGAIYILWDVEDYGRLDKTIDLGDPSTATSGLLSIYGATENDIIGNYTSEFVKIDSNDDYDMVIRSHRVDHGTTKDTGAIYIAWDIADYSGSNVTIELGAPSAATSGLLSIYGATEGDKIGGRWTAPEFVKINGNYGYDMVIRSEYVYHDTAKRSTGAFYILWDVADYSGSNVTIELGAPSAATSGLLSIYGGSEYDYIRRPQFVKIGGNDGYDMVISESYTGAIYILWDVTDYSREHKIIDLGDPSTATSGLLSIYGGNRGDSIGSNTPKFLNIDGNDEFDMVIDSYEVNHGTKKDAGAIYILWDVTDYSREHKIIDLGDPSTATSGLLSIYGGSEYDRIARPQFVKIGGNDGYDMVVSSAAAGYDAKDFTGAIYVLWDVTDYYSREHKTIDLRDPSTADHGLLSIYGGNEKNFISRPKFVKIGGNDGYDMVISSEHADDCDREGIGAIYVLWDVADYAGTNTTIDLGDLSGATSGSLTIYNAEVDLFTPGDNTNILSADIDDKGTDDLIFQSRGHTYILFGEKLKKDDYGTGNINVEINTSNLQGSTGTLYISNREKPEEIYVTDAGFGFKSDKLEDLGGFTVDGVQAAWDMLT